MFYNIFAWACAFFMRKWHTSLRCPFFNFFCAFPSSLFVIFLLQWLTFFWACFQFKKFWESIETGRFYLGVAMCSCRQFCSEFFTQISEHFRGYMYFSLHWADHSDLDIIGKIFSSCISTVLEYRWCQFWSKVMMSDTAGYGWYWSQWVKLG